MNKRSIKKWAIVLLVFAIAFSICACHNRDEEKKSSFTEITRRECASDHTWGDEEYDEEADEVYHVCAVCGEKEIIPYE